MDSWAELKPHVDALSKAVAKVPAPPVPDDDWSQKLNVIVTTTESLRQHVDSRYQAEEEGRAAR
jgi:hypothetical protein